MFSKKHTQIFVHTVFSHKLKKLSSVLALEPWPADKWPHLGVGGCEQRWDSPGRPSACQDRGATPKKASCRRISIVITFMWLHIVSIGWVCVPDVLLSAFQDWFLPHSLQLSELGTLIVPFSKQELRFKQCLQCQDHWAGQWLRWDLILGCYFQILTPYPLYKHTSWVVIWSQQHGFSEAYLLYDLKAGMSGGAQYQSFKDSTHAEGSVCLRRPPWNTVMFFSMISDWQQCSSSFAVTLFHGATLWYFMTGRTFLWNLNFESLGWAPPLHTHYIF